MLTVRYFAAARAATGRQSEEIPISAPLDRDDLIRVLVERHPEAPAGEPALSTVLAQSSLLVSGVAMRPGTTVESGAVVDVLPPFSGG
jgi:sulfur-carrier protein